MSQHPFAFNSLIYNGLDLIQDGIGNHLSLLDRLVFNDLPASHKSLLEIPNPTRGPGYGRVKQDLHFEHPNRFKNALFLDIARETWNADLIRQQAARTIWHKRVFNAVTGVYLMWESDRLWEDYADLISVYDFCIVTSSIVDDFLTNRHIEFIKLKHPYDFATTANSRPLAYGKFRFGLSAGLWSRKNVAKLAATFAEAFAGRDDVELCIHTRSDVTHTDYRSEYAALQSLQAKCPGISIIAKSLSREDYLIWLASLDMYCFVSSGEGYSVTPREALHLGIPVILFNAHVHKEFSHLPGILPVSCHGVKRAAPNISRLTFDIGNDWTFDAGELANVMRYGHQYHQSIRSELDSRISEITEYHDTQRIKNDWVNALNGKYQRHIDSVRLHYPQIDESRIDMGADPNIITLSSPNIHTSTGCFVGHRIHCLRSINLAGHCLYGPYLRIKSEGSLQAVFTIDVFTCEFSAVIANLEIYDSAGDQILTSLPVMEKTVQGISNTFTLSTRVEPEQIIEFRVYWFATSDICLSDLRATIRPDRQMADDDNN